MDELQVLSSVSIPTNDDGQEDSHTILPTSSIEQLDSTTFLPQHTTPVQVPVLRCVDKPSSSLPSILTFTEDNIRANVGFWRIDTIKRHLKHLYQDTIRLDTFPCEVPRPSTFGKVIHMDIVFGPEISIGNIHYGLLFVD
jgi:hypothetical protein